LIIIAAKPKRYLRLLDLQKAKFGSFLGRFYRNLGRLSCIVGSITTVGVELS
jgi:hypothetical protein